MSAPQYKILPEEKWLRVRALFEQCLELKAEERKALLDKETQGDVALRQEVESLLTQNEIPTHYLDKPLIQRLSEQTLNPLPLQPQTPVLERVGKYLLFHRLGSGGMAEVFLAKVIGNSGFDRLVAVKRILPHFAKEPDFKKLFEYEAKLSSRLAHANITHIYDYGDFDDSCLLVMEFINGVNLLELIRKSQEHHKKIPLEVALYIVSCIADGLDYAHRRKEEVSGEPLNIIHRDISPKNIMLSFEGEIKVVDFGIAKAQDRARHTRTGMLRGTLGYLAPEVVTGKEIDPRSDIFSACAILYELIAGNRLFESDDFYTSIQQAQDDNAINRKIETLAVDAPLRNLLKQGLTQSKEKRIPNAGILRDTLDQYLSGRSPSGLVEQTKQFIEGLFPDKIDSSRKIIQQSNAIQEAGVLTERLSLIPKKKLKLKLNWKLYIPLAIVTGVMLIASFQLLNKENIEESTTTRMKGDGTPTPNTPCYVDAARFCPDIKWKEGLVRCLKTHDAELANGCRQLIKNHPRQKSGKK